MTKLIDILVLFSLMCFCACTDYAQQIKDEFEPDDASGSSATTEDNPLPSYGYMTDERDGRWYSTVNIAGQVWMAENLNFDTGKSYCYDNDDRNCDIAGRLYEFKDAFVAACPDGWHLPSAEEFEILIKNTGGDVNAESLKSANDWNGNNSSGFNAYPAGQKRFADNYTDMGSYAYFWSATQDGANAYALMISGSLSVASVVIEPINMEQAFSVRCVKD